MSPVQCEKVKSAYEPIVAHQARAYSGFCSMKWLQSWTKVLRQIYICGAFLHAPNKFFYTELTECRCITFVNLFRKSTITVMLQNIFAGFLSPYFEEIELNTVFLRRWVMRDDQWTLTSLPEEYSASLCLYSLKQAKIGLNTRFAAI